MNRQPSAYLQLIQRVNEEETIRTALMDGLQILDAAYLSTQYHPKIDVGLPLLIQGVADKQLAVALQSTLLNAYSKEHEVLLFQGVDADLEEWVSFSLHELKQQDSFARSTSLYLSPRPNGSSFSHLQEIIAHLRSPEGCPWDRKQTFLTLRSDLLGECMEVLEAIDLGISQDNSEHISEELGDLLMAINLMVQIATEEGRFQMADVTSGIVEKLIRRHPHIFGNLAVDGVDGINANWDKIKEREREEKGEPARGPLDGIPAALPALEKARQLQSKAAKAGLLDRETLAQSQPIVTELLGENPDEEQIGAMLWQLVAVAHKAGVNAEDALRSYTVQARQSLH